MQSKITPLERNREKEMIFHDEIANKTPVCPRSYCERLSLETWVESDC